MVEEVKNLKMKVLTYRFKEQLRHFDKEIIKILDMKVKHLSHMSLFAESISRSSISLFLPYREEISKM